MFQNKHSYQRYSCQTQTSTIFPVTSILITLCYCFTLLSFPAFLLPLPPLYFLPHPFSLYSNFSPYTLEHSTVYFSIYALESSVQLTHCSLRTKSSPHSIIINKVLLEHSQAHSFTYVFGCFPAITTEFST